VDKNFTVYAFDLFYHGKSTRVQDHLHKSEWCKWLGDFLQAEKIDEFSVLGYSLGGRFAIASVLKFPDKIKELFLIAPDGIFLTPWFKLATTPGIKLLFKYLMLNPDKMERLMKFNEKSGVVNKYVDDFVRKEMGDDENRKRVYISWNYFKTLGYSKKELYRRFNRYSFDRKLIIGEKDHIIHPKGILPIVEKMGHFEVDILPLKHHQLARPEVAELLIKA